MKYYSVYWSRWRLRFIFQKTTRSLADFSSNSRNNLEFVILEKGTWLDFNCCNCGWLTCIRDRVLESRRLCSQIRVITYKLFLVLAYNSLSVTLKIFLAKYDTQLAKIILMLNKIEIFLLLI